MQNLGHGLLKWITMSWMRIKVSFAVSLHIAVYQCSENCGFAFYVNLKLFLAYLTGNSEYAILISFGPSPYLLFLSWLFG